MLHPLYHSARRLTSRFFQKIGIRRGRMQILTAAGAGEKHAAPELFDEVMDMSPKELLYIEDALESAMPNVHGAFSGALESALCMQSEVYRDMAERDWYPSEQAPQQKLDAVKQKYAGIA